MRDVASRARALARLTRGVVQRTLRKGACTYNVHTYMRRLISILERPFPRTASQLTADTAIWMLACPIGLSLLTSPASP
jgi:hypothetical protein